MEVVPYLLALASLVGFMGFARVGLGVASISSLIMIGLAVRDLSSVENYFLLILGVSSLAVFVYSMAYTKDKLQSALLPLFVLSMYGVLVSENILLFVFSWELMTLLSYLFIRDRDIGAKYFITMHIFTTIPLLLLIALAPTLSLSSLRGNLPFLLVMIAAMAKSGIVPLHFWVAETYDSAPSNVSSLFAGAMEKVALFALVKAYLTFNPSRELGLVVAILGALSLTIGTLFALKQKNAKRLLAYHSIGQMGYMWLGIGIGIYLIPSKVGYLALAAGLFHALNHSLFKGSLFLTAGAFEYSKGTVDLDKLGGLFKAMPYTGTFALLSSLAISGVPPFNGFLSKLLLYEAGYSSGDPVLQLATAFAFFISAATLASFIKFYSSAFLGGESEGSEVPVSMVVGQGIPSILCLLLGLFPLTPGVNPYSYFSSPMFLLMLAVLAVGVLVAVPFNGVEAKPWNCGATGFPEERFRLKASSYYHQYEEKIGALYSLSSYLRKAGSALVDAMASAYWWISKYFEEYIDEAIIMPVIRFLTSLTIVLRDFSVAMEVTMVLSMIILAGVIVLLVGW
ncbi:complex I subunit 5 family protein [Pyrococcus kukulkanii]|uniref:complex I subunit 5 family protein n=1 Tax=Pyrococcus kukulkanii TaxID=1609559 RepID=UPI00356A5FA5